MNLFRSIYHRDAHNATLFFTKSLFVLRFQLSLEVDFISSSSSFLFVLSFDRHRVSKFISETLNPPSEHSKQLQNVIIYDKCLMVTGGLGRGVFGMDFRLFCGNHLEVWLKIDFSPPKSFHRQPSSNDVIYRLEQVINHLYQLTSDFLKTRREKMFPIFSQPLKNCAYFPNGDSSED